MIFHIRQKFFKGILFFYSFEYVDGDLLLIFVILNTVPSLAGHKAMIFVEDFHCAVKVQSAPSISKRCKSVGFDPKFSPLIAKYKY